MSEPKISGVAMHCKKSCSLIFQQAASQTTEHYWGVVLLQVREVGHKNTSFSLLCSWCCGHHCICVDASCTPNFFISLLGYRAQTVNLSQVRQLPSRF